jgi:bacterioferritin-associated ferredoxin
MIVCVCNRLNETKIRAAIARGPSCTDEVYALCGVRKNCGRCQETIAEMMDEQADRRVLVAAE